MRPKYLLLVLINILILSPIVFLSFYNYPSADDYSYGIALKESSFWDIQVRRYLDWTSRYFATAILTISPIGFGSIKYFGVYTIVFFILNITSLSYFFKSIGIDSIKKNLFLTFSFMSIYTCLLTSLVENYFWLAGSVTYYLPSIMMIYLLGSIINVYKYDKIKDKIILIVSVFIIGGCVEIYIGYTFIILALVNIYHYLTTKRINSFFLTSNLISFMIICLVVFSPGNSTREELTENNLGLVDLLQMTFRKLILLNFKYNIIGLIFMLSVLKILKISIKLPGILLLKIISAMVFFQLIGIFVALYSLKYYYPPRVENLLVFTSFVFILFIASKILELFNPQKELLYILSATACLSLFIIPKNSYQKQNNIALMYHDIFCGKVLSYKRQVLEREQLLQNCKKECVIKPFINPPRSIMFKDVSSDDKNYYNKSLAKFYNLDKVSLD